MLRLKNKGESLVVYVELNHSSVSSLISVCNAVNPLLTLTFICIFLLIGCVVSMSHIRQQH